MVFFQLNVNLYDSLLSEVSHDEGKMRERGETLLSLIFASSGERPLIAGNLYGRLFKDSGSNYLRNIFTALAVGLSGEAKFQKC